MTCIPYKKNIYLHDISIIRKLGNDDMTCIPYETNIYFHGISIIHYNTLPNQDVS